MFHFLNKTYLKYHEMFEYSQDSILCFDTNADVVNYDSEVGKFLTGVKSRVLSHVKNVDELIAMFKGDTQFLTRLINYGGMKGNGKLNIYCDPASFNTLVIKLWKTIFPKLTSESGYILYDVCRNNALFQTRHDWHDEHDNDPNDYHRLYWSLDKESFSMLFNSVKPFKPVSILLKNISTEYLIALYLSHPGDVGYLLEEKYKHFYDKALVSDLNSLKKELEDYLYELDDIWSELGRQDHDNFDFNKIVSIKPELAFLGRPDFNGAKSIVNIIPQEELSTMIKLIKDYFKWSGKDSQEMVVLQDLIRGNKLSMTEIIDRDLNYRKLKGQTCPPVLSRMHESGKLNMYLISYFVRLKELNKLNDFRLV